MARADSITLVAAGMAGKTTISRAIFQRPVWFSDTFISENLIQRRKSAINFVISHRSRPQ
jgi:hypothetical protein